MVSKVTVDVGQGRGGKLSCGENDENFFSWMETWPWSNPTHSVSFRSHKTTFRWNQWMMYAGKNSINVTIESTSRTQATLLFLSNSSSEVEYDFNHAISKKKIQQNWSKTNREDSLTRVITETWIPEYIQEDRELVSFENQAKLRVLTNNYGCENRIRCQTWFVKSDLNGGVFVIGTTSRIESVDGGLRRAGRFREIAIGIPDKVARREILEVVCKLAPTIWVLQVCFLLWGV